MKQIRKRLTYANVMSTIAVFLVVGGASALAASQLGKNTVGSKQLKKNAVTAAKIKNNAVTTAKIANGAVISAKLADGSVITGKLVDGAVTTGKVTNKAITTAKIADKAVNTGQLAEGAVTTGKLGDLAVNSGKLAADAVTSGKIQDGQVLGTDLGAIVVRTHVDTGIGINESDQAIASCVGTERLLSGGGLWSGSNTLDAQLRASFPSGNNWVAQGRNNQATALEFTAYALCLQ